MKFSICLSLFAALLFMATLNLNAQGLSNDEPVVDVRGLPLDKALAQLAALTKVELVLSPNLVKGKVSTCLTSAKDAEAALHCVLAGTGLGIKKLENGTFVIIEDIRKSIELEDVTDFAGSLRGVVKESNGDAVAGANIRLLETTIGAASDSEGRYLIQLIPQGNYTVQASMLGFESARKEISIQGNEVLSLDFVLDEETVSLSEIVVTPGRHSLMHQEAMSPQSMSQNDVRSVPQIGEDVYRAVARLPGLSSNDFSAKFTVRGGEHEEVLVTLDGLELYNPFHMKDINGGTVSAVDVEAIGGIDLLTGAFPSEYGDKLSGVFNITSSEPSVNRTSVGLSFINARFLSEGNFNEGKGSWMVLGRRGYMDLVLKFVQDEENLLPVYYDAFAKLKYRPKENHSISIQGLFTDDDMTYQDEDDPRDFANMGYRNYYTWLNWKAAWNSKIYSQTVLSVGSVSNERYGIEKSFDENLLNFEVQELNSFEFVGIKQDWSFEISRNAMLKMGANFKLLNADYDYLKRIRTGLDFSSGTREAILETTDIDYEPSGEQLGLYASQRLRLGNRLTGEVGLRYDYAGWSRDDLISPRVNLAFQLAKQTALRGGWGHFHQTQGIHELDVRDSYDQFNQAEKSEHLVLGLEHKWGNNAWTARADIYRKDLSNLNPRFINLYGGIEFFPEATADRAPLLIDSGKSQGFELYVKKQNGGKINGWASYSLASAEDYIGDQVIPKEFDQRHTFYMDLNYRPSEKWSANMSFQYHGGWPYTGVDFVLRERPDGSLFAEEVWGPPLGERYPAYHRLDLRVNRLFRLNTGLLAVFLEARNVYNRGNVQAYEYDQSLAQDGSLEVTKFDDYWFPIMPSFGIRWDILH